MEDNIKMDPREVGREARTGSLWLRIGHLGVGGCCEWCNEPLVFIKWEEFIE
jgi:hypothetical protein